MRAHLSRAPLLAALVMLAWSFLPSLQAQRNQPIYPVYDGYVKHPDGTLTVSFAYFSHNADPVTIPPGADNRFTPEPADRQQPTTFYPGHHRFQCIMLVGPDFDGKLRWHLSYAGTTTGTSERMLQYNWELDENGARQALRGVDLTKAPRNVCLNRPPLVRILGLTSIGADARGLTVTLPDELRLFGSIEDEGQPRGGTIEAAWSKVSGPGTVTFANPRAARTRAAFGAPGTYELELWASDSALDARARVTVTVTSRER